MEQHLRIALCMVFIIGYLQAKPLCFNQADLGLKLLSDYVTCDPSVNFTSPSNVKKHCYAAALKCFQDGLHSVNNCTGQLWRIGDTAEALQQATTEALQQTTTEALQQTTTEALPQTTESPARPVESPDCQWENKPFADFVKDIKTFAEQVNSDHQGRC